MSTTLVLLQELEHRLLHPPDPGARAVRAAYPPAGFDGRHSSYGSFRSPRVGDTG
jgi:hypothetical protein